MKLHSQPLNPSFHLLSISDSKSKNWHIVFDSAISELIPSSVGQGTTRKSVQNRTLALWAFLTSAGLGIFYQKAYDLSQNARAAALGLVFPGAGFVACANITGALSFVLTWALVPLALFAVSQCIWLSSSRLMHHSGSEPGEFYFLSLSGVFHQSGHTMLLVMRSSNQLD